MSRTIDKITVSVKPWWMDTGRGAIVVLEIEITVNGMTYKKQDALPHDDLVSRFDAIFDTIRDELHLHIMESTRE